MRYYILDEKQPLGFLEVSKDEYIALFGDENIRTYVSAVYQGEILIDDVPAELRASVQTVVDNRINRWGLYENIEDTPIESERNMATEEVANEN